MKAYTHTLLTITASLGACVIASALPEPVKGPKPPSHHLTFAAADANGDGGLSLFEFAKTQGPGTPLVEIRSRFLAIDVSGAFEAGVDPVTNEPVQGDPIPDGLVSLEELEAYRALEDKPKSTLSRFELADFDGDGFLTPVEFGYLVSPKVPLRNISRNFIRLDEDEDILLSPVEFRKPAASEL